MHCDTGLFPSLSHSTRSSLFSSSSPSFNSELVVTNSEFGHPCSANSKHMMATSSATSSSSASPPMSYLQANAIPPSATVSLSGNAGVDPTEREERKKAVQKFLARAEISMVTRGLRARLSYASYKAAHNIPHIPLRDLEAQSHSHSQSYSQGQFQAQSSLSQAATSRIIGAKRKVGGVGGGNNNYYNNPATQGVHAPPNNSASINYGAQRGRGTMPPPATASRANYYPNTVANPPAHTNRGAQQSQSLYSSILAPPPAKQARTIHNPRDPPIAAPTRPPVTPKSQRGGRGAGGSGGSNAKVSEASGVGTGRTRALSLVEGTRSHDAKGRREEFTGAVEKRKRTTHKDKGKGKQKLGRTDTQPVLDGDTDVDVDMKAAATLTSLLLQHHSRPSMTASTHATSPRSSLSNGSDHDTGSVKSGFSRFGQSSARTVGGGTPTAANTNTLTTAPTQLSLSQPHSAESSFATTVRSTTPPPSNSQTSISDLTITGTPRAKKSAPTDSEAADLMLYLATSPSPVRPERARGGSLSGLGGLGGDRNGGGLRAKGRVLFAGAGGGKGDEGSFASSVGVGGSDVNMDIENGLSINTSSVGKGRGLEANVIPPTPTHLAPTPSQLLPPPPSPSPRSGSGDTTPGAHHHRSQSLPQLQPQCQIQSQSQTPTPAFNLTDFINVSPSPAAPAPGHKLNGGLGSSLRADVRRRLFEEEQSGRGQDGGDGGGGSGEQQQQSGLGAGIDML